VIEDARVVGQYLKRDLERGVRIRAAIGLTAFLTASTALGADFVEPQDPAGALQVLNAFPAAPSKWPATFIFSAASGGCTSTAIGSNIILTAAHCVNNGGVGTVRVNDKTFPLTCEHHPGYATRSATLDFALCLLQGSLSGIYFENVSTSLAHARVGQQVTLLGYGCTEEGGFDRGFGVLYEGKSTVTRKPKNESADTVTKGNAAVCFGDSGGAAYFETTTNGKNRVIIGVNSRGDISELTFISSTATTEFVDWAVDWSVRNHARICGIDPAATGCRPL
jgi:Trypsin